MPITFTERNNEYHLLLWLRGEWKGFLTFDIKRILCDIFYTSEEHFSIFDINNNML